MPLSLPAPGSTWTTAAGETWTVAAITGARVLLYGENGAFRDVQAYAWPGDFTRAATVDPGSTEPVIAMLLGGATGDHFRRIRDQALALGIAIDVHLPYNPGRGMGTTRIPVDVQLVIGLVSHADHSSMGEMRAQAKARGLPVALVPSAGFKAALAAEIQRLRVGTPRPGYGALGPGPPLSLVHRPWREWDATSQAWIVRGASVPGPREPGEETVLALVLAGIGAGLAWRS